MDLGIAGKAALVCASTGGLGAATAQALAAEGARVVFSGRRGELAEKEASAYDGSVGIEADLSSVEGAQQLLTKAREAVGDIDILVLNGPGPKPGTALDVNGEDMLQAVTSLAIVQQSLVEACLPHMREQKWGRILSIASTGVVAPITGLALSSVGRMALAGYLKSLANVVAADGVTVNMLLPGRIATDRVGQLDANAAEQSGKSVEEVAKRAAASIPAKRYGAPAEFGATAAFLCSDLASYITGSAVRCDGGLHTTL
ncbi:SDR family oxidoreductase [Epidermidibacterium keratini]|uniref:SDR family oxidoreductase n=1 Tax=Epidermidibacterium keratini TaxID=1891644 RepID=A0A7L4YN32_9ACTN|nr:SDR family oxidoreductase [Epidermidibacterium keratini]QHC00685.1 SDR family oxidoreductase [Epidermidibacterium keratini]